MKKTLIMIVGLIALIIGSVGIVIPILPTTPFLIIASFCFMKSSKRFHTWFNSIPIYQKHLKPIISDRSLDLKTKLMIIIPASILMGSILIFTNNIYLKMFMACLILVKYYIFFILIKTNPLKNS